MEHSEIFQANFLDTFEQLASDKVVNVRISLAKTVAEYLKSKRKHTFYTSMKLHYFAFFQQRLFIKTLDSQRSSSLFLKILAEMSEVTLLNSKIMYKARR